MQTLEQKRKFVSTMLFGNDPFDISDGRRFSDDSIFLVGGYVRDVAAGVHPKDCDVAILNTCDYTAEELFGIVSGVCLHARGVFDAYVEVYQAYQDATTDFNEHILCGAKIIIGENTYDLLFFKHNNIEDVISTFDYNWNQQYIGANSSRYWIGRQHPLMATGNPLREGRADYMLKKYQEAFECTP